MATFTEVLGGGAAVDWTPGPWAGGGVATVKQRRCYVTYRVTAFRADWAGVAARFEKAAGEAGTDPGERAYDVFVGPAGGCRCDCKGFARYGRCKHAAAAAALVANGWLAAAG